MDLPRGMKDFENLEIQKIEYIRQHFIQTANTFGFELMVPSPIELMSVIEAKSGPTIPVSYTHLTLPTICSV